MLQSRRSGVVTFATISVSAARSSGSYARALSRRMWPPAPLRARRVGGPHNRAGALDLTRSFRQRVLALKVARAISAHETLLLAIMRADREVQDRRDRQEITYASLRHAAVMVMMAASSHPVGTKPPSIISC